MYVLCTVLYILHTRGMQLMVAYIHNYIILSSLIFWERSSNKTANHPIIIGIWPHPEIFPCIHHFACLIRLQNSKLSLTLRVLDDFNLSDSLYIISSLLLSMSSIKSTHSQRPSHPKQGSSYENQQNLANLQDFGTLPRKAGERSLHNTNKRSKHPPFL